ncbi:hypothetical protein E0765_04760 [Sulfuricurvum sp. IAE1]|uniref:hypothetical protein n=1 Tax=Sulfuricurvum sp. IAE1 TaxID=2546102 RepID=UPI001050872A|nr:hypothetical protein [Sulfuricurvum sp. IAE1]TDA65796.1 hypothetical protein E0765_04760 [Sulfuricurvum sp. IAE1]
MTKTEVVERFSKVVNNKTDIYQQYNNFIIDLRSKGIIGKNEIFTAQNLKTRLVKLGVKL